MTGEPAPSNGGYRLIEVLDRLRDDIRDDIRYQLAEHEKRMNASVQLVDSKVTTFIVDHGKAHEAQEAERRGNQQRINDFIEQAKLTRARNDGVFATLLFLLQVLSKHWQIIAIGVTLLLGALGAVRVQVGP